MFNLKYIKNQKFNEAKLVEVLFYTFPLSFIIGNFALTLHLLFFISISLFLIKKRQLPFKFKNLYWLLISFFSYLFILTVIQYQSPKLLMDSPVGPAAWNEQGTDAIFKSFSLIRFIILIFIVDILFSNKIINLKKLFLFSLFCTSFVSFDILVQYFTGFDLFGLKGDKVVAEIRHNSGPFGDEYIAGSYLQKFSFLSIFYIFEIFKNKKFNKSLLIFVIVLHATAILFTGNRMPLILFLFGCGLVILFIKNLRFAMSASLVIFLISSSIIMHIARPADTNTFLKTIYNDFEKYVLLYKVRTKDSSTIKKIQDVAKSGGEKILKRNEDGNIDLEEVIRHLRDPGYAGIFKTSIMMWKEKPFVGFGLKSFRIKCWDILSKNELLDKPLHISCSNHSHNYYLQFLTETGIFGAGLIIIFFIILLKDSFYFYKKKYNQKNNLDINLLIPIIILLIVEIWPIRSAGSFFSTWNATFFWLCASILLAASKQNGESITKR